MGLLMGLMGGYRALGGRNVAFKEEEFPKWPYQWMEDVSGKIGFQRKD